MTKSDEPTVHQSNYTENHRKQDKNTPNQSFSIGIECLKKMGLRNLIKFWNKDLNLRKKRLNIILLSLIVENESD